MPKRLAEKQLTQDNAQQYLDEDNNDEEQRGEFQKANKEEMSARVIKSAVRRKPGTDGSTAMKGLFSGINFSTLSSSSPTSTSGSLVTGSSLISSAQKLPSVQSSLGNPLMRPSLGAASGVASCTVAASKPVAAKGGESSEYLSNLKSLNTSVLEWIQKHVRENPYIDLTPVFKDYTKHIQEIEEKFGPGSSASVSEGGDSQTDSEYSQTTDVSVCTLSQKSDASDPSASPKLLGFYPPSQTKPLDTPSPLPSILTKSTLLQPLPASKALLMGQSLVPPVIGALTSSDSQPETPSGDEDAPPTAAKSDPGPGEVRAKLFYKKDNEYVTLGVGNLKVEPKSGKAWLLMRSDTVTKKTLLSVNVTSATPLQQTEKSILFVTPPNPPLYLKNADSKAPVSYVLRVKTVEEATKLLESIKEARS